MSLIIDKKVFNIYDSGNLKKTIRDPIRLLPNELIVKIFSHLNLATLGTICFVSKAWKQLANTPILLKTLIYREVAFGNDKWARCFGKNVVKDEDYEEEFSSLPWKDFIADCKKFKGVFPEKKAKDCLMLVRIPKTLNGQLTLKSLGELAKKFFTDSEAGYRFFYSDIAQELGDKRIHKSYWVLMTKDLLPKSRSKSYSEQKKMIANLAVKSLIDYEVPKALEFAVCTLSQYFDSGIRLFNIQWTYTRCKEKVKGYRVIGGGFAQDGLSICNPLNRDNESYGIAALRRF